MAAEWPLQFLTGAAESQDRLRLLPQPQAAFLGTGPHPPSALPSDPRGPLCRCLGHLPLPGPLLSPSLGGEPHTLPLLLMEVKMRVWGACFFAEWPAGVWHKKARFGLAPLKRAVVPVPCGHGPVEAIWGLDSGYWLFLPSLLAGQA